MLILDTNVVSELRKVKSGRADRHVAQWSEGIDASDAYISTITVQELEIGVLLAERRDSVQGAMLRLWLNQHVLPAFEGRVLPVDMAVALISAKFHVPDPRPVRDSLIAATAVVHGMTIVTRNISDFDYSGVALLNPWAWGESQ